MPDKDSEARVKGASEAGAAEPQPEVEEDEKRSTRKKIRIDYSEDKKVVKDDSKSGKSEGEQSKSNKNEKEEDS